MSEPPKVLVVDDETAMRDLLYETLARQGYEVMTAVSGAQACEVLKSNRPDVIVLDTMMPGRSGLETACRIREFDDAVPIVLLQGVGEPEIAQETRQQAGITEIIRKELGAELFLGSAIELALKRHNGDPQHRVTTQAAPLHGTLLIVDDEAQVRRLLQTFFESRGLHVLLATSGEEALQTLAQKPDLVLLDINLSGMDGLVALKRFKAQQPTLPVIIASGVGEDTIVQEALQAGAYGYVYKPFNLEYLETVVLTKLLLGPEG